MTMAYSRAQDYPEAFAPLPTPPRTPTPPSVSGAAFSRPSGQAGKKLLFIDAYDSFTNNIIGLFSEVTDEKIDVIRIDDDVPDLGAFLERYDGVIAGPGPGHPANPEDIGLIAQLWRLPPNQLRPVLAICLGFQSLVLEFGGTVTELSVPKHGIVSPIIHQGSSIFDVLEGYVVSSTRYHSLRASLPRQSEGIPSDPWAAQGVLIPLAYALDAENGSVLMSVRHATLPFYGVQFHPESICSDRKSFSRIVDRWMDSIKPKHNRKRCKGIVNDPMYPLAPRYLSLQPSRRVKTEVLELGQLSTSDLKTHLGFQSHGPTSQLDSMAHPGHYSILVPNSSVNNTTVQYSIGETQARWYDSSHNLLNRVPLSRYGNDIWQYLNAFMSEHAATGGHPDSPFWGGMIGYFSYEVGLAQGLQVGSTGEHKFPDISLQFVSDSILVDQRRSKIFIQSIDQDGQTWCTKLAAAVKKLRAQLIHDRHHHPNPIAPRPTKIRRPSRTAFREAFGSCKAAVKIGNSYELCLTNQTTIHVPAPAKGADRNACYERYQSLCQCNPAPYAAYLYHPDVTVLSSSPERFMSWKRHGSFEMRPIKGTVKKTTGMTRQRATEILSTDKERAENMMIADLVRHDLAGALSSGTFINVKGEFGRVEEYETVFQLVSVIQGQLSVQDRQGNLWLDQQMNEEIEESINSRPRKLSSRSSHTVPTGLDVLRSTLPAGSMTGAPKRRTCELLYDLEQRNPRRVYSGVLGYLDVGGGGDFSVVIRTAFRWSAESTSAEATSDGTDVWRIGAGGAITQLSTEEDEWEEMNTKLNSTLTAFVGQHI